MKTTETIVVEVPEKVKGLSMGDGYSIQPHAIDLSDQTLLFLDTDMDEAAREIIRLAQQSEDPRSWGFFNPNEVKNQKGLSALKKARYLYSAMNDYGFMHIFVATCFLRAPKEELFRA